MVPAILSKALRELRATVQGERYLVAWFPEPEQFEVVASFGFEVERIEISEFLSLTILKGVAKRVQARWSDPDLPGDDGTLSYQLSGIKSYLCIPVKLEGGVGILYADHRSARNLFTFTDLTNAQNLARRLTRPGTSAAPPRAPPPPTPLPPAAEREAPQSRLPATHQVNLLRCLAVLLQAGISLLAALESLAEQAETRRLRLYCSGLREQVMQGRALSDAMRGQGGYPRWVDRMLLSAERSGQLVLVLQSLADHLERGASRRRRLAQSLQYPAAVLLLVMLGVLLLAPQLLRGPLQAMGPLPWPTRALLLLSEPFCWIGLTLLVAGSVRLLSTSSTRLWLHRLLLNCSLTRRVYQARQEVTLATSLQLQLQAGVPLLEALRSAFLLCDPPDLTAQAAVSLGRVTQGDPLSEALAPLPWLGAWFCHLLRAGEESGHTVNSLGWIARAAQLEFDDALDRAQSLLEPLVLLLLGVLVGLVCVATLMPTLQMLERL